MKTKIITFSFFVLLFFSLCAVAQPTVLGGFQKSIYNDEQIKIFSSPVWAPDVKFHINAPSAATFDPKKKVKLIFFALPNGNTTENTIGNTELIGVDWHYDIQHIGAQTRYLRSKITDANVVVCYLETNQQAWSTWRSKYPDATIKTMVDSVRAIFKTYDTRVTLSSHSGGGYFMFGYINSVTEIPTYVERISFLDSNYGYDEALNHGKKLSQWLKASATNTLSVLAYNDSVALLNGLPIVSATGGTWYRSKRMVDYLKNDFAFSSTINADYWKYQAQDNRIEFILKTNPEKAILHTVQVERNGFIQSILSGTPLEGIDYTYYPLTAPTRAYSNFIQANLTYSGAQFVSRSGTAITGSAFMDKIKSMTYLQREPLIIQEIKNGNTPDFCKSFVDVNFHYNGQVCKVQVIPDYLAIGSNTDFCRIPVSPQTAQALADYLGCTLPTTRIVDSVSKAATYRIAPITHAPVGSNNELVDMFTLHNQEIEQALAAVGTGWDRTTNIVDGLKKDIVITNRLLAETGKVAIYGWYNADGTYIQPLYLGHTSIYMDYSHGVRFVNSLVWLDGKPTTIQKVLKDAVLYPMLSAETGVMVQPYYVYGGSPKIPLAPKSFGIKTNSSTSLKIVFTPVEAATAYQAYLSKDGVNYDSPIEITDSTNVINNLDANVLYYIKLKAYNESGISAFSETLMGEPSDKNPTALIVHGFDRPSVGNKFDFVKYHAKAMSANGIYFETATNDAVTDNLMNLVDFNIVDYVIGDESTANETLSTAEQSLIKVFLMRGGKLYISGSELAWDLDKKGTLTDIDFCHTFLKIKFINDAPANVSGIYYKAEPVSGTAFGDLLPFNYDNGTQGTINVVYPDQMDSTQGSFNFLKYSDTPTAAYAGVYFEGLFPGGTKIGKVVSSGIPFETVYPEESRKMLMGKILDFFEHNTNTGISQPENLNNKLSEMISVTPNPAIDNIIVKSNGFEMEKVTLYDLNGRLILSEMPNNNQINVSISTFQPGVYILKVKTTFGTAVKRIIKQ